MRPVVGGSTVAEFAALASLGMTGLSQVTAFETLNLWRVKYPSLGAARTMTGAWRGPETGRPSMAEVPHLITALQNTRASATTTLLQKAAALGGHGIVGVTIEHQLLHVPLRQQGAVMGLSIPNMQLQLQMTATVVRTRDGAAVMSALTGVELATLARSGRAAAGLAWGVGAVMWDSPVSLAAQQLGLRGGRNAADGELTTPSTAHLRARRLARDAAVAQLGSAALAMVQPSVHLSFDLERAEVRSTFCVVSAVASGAKRVGGADTEPPLAVLPMVAPPRARGAFS